MEKAKEEGREQDLVEETVDEEEKEEEKVVGKDLEVVVSTPAYLDLSTAKQEATEVAAAAAEKVVVKVLAAMVEVMVEEKEEEDSVEEVDPAAGGQVGEREFVVKVEVERETGKADLAEEEVKEMGEEKVKEMGEKEVKETGEEEIKETGEEEKETEAEEKEEEARVAVVALEDTTSRRIRTQDQRVFLLSYPTLQAILSSLKHSCNSPLIE